jgi:MscS family membrane protein
LPFRRLHRFLAVLFLVLAPACVLAQSAPTPAATPAIAPDPYGRDTPRGAITGLIGALAEKDYERAARFFDLPMQDARVRGGAAELARRLQVLLDNGGTLQPFGALSNEPGGRIDDDLPPARERVGTLPLGDPPEPILLAQSNVGGRQLWRLSHETIRQLMAAPATAAVAEDKPVETGVAVAGAPVEDWALLLAIAALSFVVLRLLSAGVLMAVRRTMSAPEQNSVYRFLHAALPPLSLFVAVIAFFIWAERLPVAIVARQTLLRYGGVVALIALVWFGLRLVDAIAEVTIARMHRRERRQAISVVTLLRRSAKILLLAVTVVGVLDTFGIDVTTGIAALGIGGIALALGAQKTVENLVGSVTVIADRPVQVGDFCRVGDVVGTVEDVGIRSTRIRTNERTVVTIPNGDFAARQIENFAKRERYLFAPVIGIEYTSAAKVREAIAIVEQVLADSGKMAEGYRATLAAFGDSSLNIEVFSHIDVTDFTESVRIKQELLLGILERFEAAGVGIAFPTRTVLVKAAEAAPAG